MTRAVFLVTRPFLPVVGGRERMLRQHLEYLVQRFDEVMVICFKGAGEKVEVARFVREFPSVDFHFTNYPGVLDVLRGVFSQGLSAPLQCLAFFGIRKSRWLSDKVIGFSPDVVVVDMLRLWSYAKNWSLAPIVLDIDDLLSVRYERQLASGAIDVLGTFRERLPSALSWVAGFFAATLLKIESKRLMRLELDVVARVSSVIFVSGAEERRHRRATGALNLYSAPPMVAEVGALKSLRRLPVVGKPLRLAFLGNLKAPQNLQALRYVMGTLVPVLDAAGVEYVVDVLGSIDSGVVDELAHEKVTFHGFVENLGEALREADIHLAPILSGTGVKTKIIDAFALGIPTLTTPLGLEGLDVDGQDVALVFNTPELFLALVKRAIAEPAGLQRISANASAYVLEKHSRDVVFARYSEAYEMGRA